MPAVEYAHAHGEDHIYPFNHQDVHEHLIRRVIDLTREKNEHEAEANRRWNQGGDGSHEMKLAHDLLERRWELIAFAGAMGLGEEIYAEIEAVEAEKKVK